MPKIFPNDQAENLVISIAGIGARSGFSTLITDKACDFQFQDNGQCFPLKLYEPIEEDNAGEGELFSSVQLGEVSKDGKFRIRDGISDLGLQHFQSYYSNSKITKEDLFYYIYGLLHSEDYRKKYSDNLGKELPRIPPVKKFEDFMTFSNSGRGLANLHLNYENAAIYPVTFGNDMNRLSEGDYHLIQMKFAVKGDKSRIVYNQKISFSDIPIEAYEYVVNGKPALEWVMERQAEWTHKDSGIANSANDWAREMMRDPAYPLKLFQRVITVSLETMKIVNSLPKLDI